MSISHVDLMQFIIENILNVVSHKYDDAMLLLTGVDVREETNDTRVLSSDENKSYRLMYPDETIKVSILTRYTPTAIINENFNFDRMSLYVLGTKSISQLGRKMTLHDKVSYFSAEAETMSRVNYIKKKCTGELNERALASMKTIQLFQFIEDLYVTTTVHDTNGSYSRHNWEELFSLTFTNDATHINLYDGSNTRRGKYFTSLRGETINEKGKIRTKSGTGYFKVGFSQPKIYDVIRENVSWKGTLRAMIHDVLTPMGTNEMSDLFAEVSLLKPRPEMLRSILTHSYDPEAFQMDVNASRKFADLLYYFMIVYILSHDCTQILRILSPDSENITVCEIMTNLPVLKTPIDFKNLETKFTSN